MKIRMKNNHDVVEEVFDGRKRIEVEASGSYMAGWTQRGERDGVVKFFSNLDWEPIPEERWENVTLKCDAVQVGTMQVIADMGRNGHSLVGQFHAPYRLVKKSLWECLPEGLRHDTESYRSDSFWGHAMDSLKRTFVFKVERKVSA